MRLGDLDTRVLVKRLTKTSDGYGGFTSTSATEYTIWANVKELSGEITTQNGKRDRYVSIEVRCRKRTGDQILDGDLLQIEGVSGDYRINNRFDDVQDFYTTIEATRKI